MNKTENLLSPLPSTGSLWTNALDILKDFNVADGSPALGDIHIGGKDIFAEKHRKSWDKSAEARCNFEYRPRLTKRADVWFLSIWEKSLMGRTLSDIKADPEEVPHFAQAAADLISEVLGDSLCNGSWCICTTPKRRHKERNFATLICIEIAKRLNIPFYEDVAFCKNRQRVNAVFSLNILPVEPNVIVFDDFVTTGCTLKAMMQLLRPLGKTLFFATGINNKL